MTVTLNSPENTPEEYKKKQDFSIIEQAVVQGDLSKLTPHERVFYYNKVCESIGLNPYTRPFDYISLNGKLTLYAKKDATEQLRKLNGISIPKLEDKVVDDLYIVKATAQDKNGRIDTSTGAVTIGHLKGEAKANAIMKAETKAKRRVTLSISGLGWCDETEIENIPNAKPVIVNMQTGEIDVTNTAQIPKAEKVSEKQLSILLDLMKQVTEKNLADLWNNLTSEYKLTSKCEMDIPAEAFQRCEKFLNLCIDINKRKQMVS